MKTVTLLLLSVFFFFKSQGQNSPFIIYGNGLDGSTYQKTAIYSDINGLIFEAPLNSTMKKLPVSFLWRGGGMPSLFIDGNSQIGIGTNLPKWKLHIKGGAITAEGDGASNYSDFNLVNGNKRWHISGPRYGENNRLGIFYQDDMNTGTFSDYFSITSNGFVGVGAGIPSQKLSIFQGNISVENYGFWLGVSSPGNGTKTYARLLGTDIANASDMACLTTNGYVNTNNNKLIQDNSALPTWALTLDATADAFYIKRASSGSTLPSNLKKLFIIKNSGLVGI
jgi:hypothetical protein